MAVVEPVVICILYSSDTVKGIFGNVYLKISDLLLKVKPSC